MRLFLKLSYCKIFDPSSVIKCLTCSKWFCNSRGGTSASHAIHHFVRSKHKEASLHTDSPLGDTILECYLCGCRNVFNLGFIPAKTDTVVVLLCRQPCASGASINSDLAWDLSLWQPLISDRMFLSWLLKVPEDADRKISTAQIGQLEEAWREARQSTSFSLFPADGTEAAANVIPVALSYATVFSYQEVFEPLVKLEAEYDRTLKESQSQSNVAIRWDIGLNGRTVAWFTASNLDSDARVCPGDEMRIKQRLNGWEAVGQVIKVGNPFATGEEIGVELGGGFGGPSRSNQSLSGSLSSVSSASGSGAKPPTHIFSGYSIEFVWKPTSYERMLKALRKLTLTNLSTSRKAPSTSSNAFSCSPLLVSRLLGENIPNEPPAFISNPPVITLQELPSLNPSQSLAVQMALQRPLSLIQGPPGTGKTVTSATLVYHLVKGGRSGSGSAASKTSKSPLLICAPSNVAVDQLTEKIASIGLRVVRVAAKSRELLESSVASLSLHERVKREAMATPGSELGRLFKLLEEQGELSARDETRLAKLRKSAERSTLNSCDVVCTTCVGAGDPRLASRRFRAVLIDEATQATEPETLIPIVHAGVRQVILVGDHKQLGPVIMNKAASKAGLAQSLFERLILLGHRPIRLAVQYRMHPLLSTFPSNMFYEGALQNGISENDRLRKLNGFVWPNQIPMFFLACTGIEEISSSGTSFLNRGEASLVEKLATSLIRDDGIDPSSIGVITPYEGQRAYIVNTMAVTGSLPSSSYGPIEVASVDAFQGREKDYIILSCVRSNDHQGIGFLSDGRRLNVALTRAKYGLILLGNPRVLSRNALWHALLSYFSELGVLVEGPLHALRPCTTPLSKPRKSTSAIASDELKKTSSDEISSLSISGSLSMLTINSETS